MTAEQAYSVLLGNGRLGTAQIPDTVSATLGYLTEDDTTPPADRMLVWAFRVRITCISTFKATDAQCDQWTFARASDGKALSVVDQRAVS